MWGPFQLWNGNAGGESWNAAEYGPVRKKQAQEYRGAETSGPSPKIYWLSMNQESVLVQSGYPAEAPALLYDKKHAVFQSAFHIISELTQSMGSVTVDHDEEWTKYKGVGEQFKAMCGEENCFALAASQEHGKWAAGFHAGRKGREAAARLALAVAIVKGTDKETHVRRTYPDFAAMLDGTQPNLTAAAAAAATAGGLSAELLQSALLGAGLAAAAVVRKNTTCPTVSAITIAPTSKIVMQGFPQQAIAIAYDKAFADAFGNAGNILNTLIDTVPVDIVHDPEWKEYPEIVASLKPAGLQENCFAVGMCPSLGKWALGLAGNWKQREHATRLALSVSVAGQSTYFQSACKHFPEFHNMMLTSGLIQT